MVRTMQARRRVRRAELLLRLGELQAVTCRATTRSSYQHDGRIAAATPVHPRVPRTVTKRTTTDLDSWPYPKQPLVPVAETVHERMSVEIFRGCTRGCRFCQAGMITRPVRERSIAGIGEMVERGLAASGYNEVGLLSLSSADHSEIAEITKGLADRYEGTSTSLVLPSHPGGRVQRRPRRRAVPQRPALRADVRPGGRLGADPTRDQQDGVRGRPDPHHRAPRSPRAGGRSSCTSCAGCRPRPTRTSPRSPAWRIG